MKISEKQWSWWFLFSIVTFSLGLFNYITIENISESNSIFYKIVLMILLFNAVLALTYAIKQIKKL